MLKSGFGHLKQVPLSLIKMHLSVLGAALISMMRSVTHLLMSDDKYVRYLTIGFSKASDTVNHVVLVCKLCLEGLSANIFNWIVFSDIVCTKTALCRLCQTFLQPITLMLEF